MRLPSTVNAPLPYVRRCPSNVPTMFVFVVPRFVNSTSPKTFSPSTFFILSTYSPVHICLTAPQIPDHFPDHSPIRDCGSIGVCASAGVTVNATITKAINNQQSVLTIGFSFADLDSDSGEDSTRL